MYELSNSRGNEMIDQTIIVVMGIVIAVAIFVGITARLIPRPKNAPDPLTDAQNDAVNKYMREHPAPSLLIGDDNEVKPVYALDDRFMQKVNKLEIDGKLYNVVPVWKPELVGVRNSGYHLECTAHDGPPLWFSKDSLRQLKKDGNLVLYCVTEVDFKDETV